MNKPCSGSRDKSVPRDVIWKNIPHKLFFGHSYTPTWGAGGVAFLHPQSNPNDTAYMCIYRITCVVFLFTLNILENTFSFVVDDVFKPYYIHIYLIVQSHC